jgi:hypothetical protein
MPSPSVSPAVAVELKGVISRKMTTVDGDLDVVGTNENTVRFWV